MRDEQVNECNNYLVNFFIQIKYIYIKRIYEFLQVDSFIASLRSLLDRVFLKIKSYRMN